MDRRTREDVGALYSATSGRLVGLLVTMGCTRDEAEELVQDAYVQLVRHWTRVGSYEDPEGWVRGVAIRLVISRRRRQQVARLGLLRLGAAPQQAEPSLDRVHLDTALRNLPAPQRAVVVLHYVLDLPVEAIARELDVPVGTVKSRLARGRAALMSQLEEEPANYVF